MSGVWDANLKLLYPVDDNQFTEADTITANSPFDLIANVEIGDNLHQVVNRHDVFAAVMNLSQGTVIGNATGGGALAPANGVFLQEVRIDFNPPAGGWAVNDGDVLQAVAAYKVTAGVNTDYSTAESVMFIVTS